MEIKVIDANNLILNKIVALGKKNAKTLGMFPEGAFIDHAKKRCIIAAIEKNILLGYVLFRITQSKGIVTIAHLCVDLECRNKGIAKKLLDAVKNKYRHLFRGIALSCRKDYIEASRFYEKNGFKAIKEVRSRSKEEKYLVKWFYDFGNQDLFSSIHISDSKFNVLLDANILIKLRDIKEDEISEIQALNADWLDDEVEYFYAQEMLNEINRDSDKERANSTRQFINKYKGAIFNPEERNDIYRELEKFIYGKSTNDISDKNQLSECIASGIDCFITTDNNILGASDKVYNLYSVKILTPSEFILHIDQLKNKDNYNSVRLAGANYETKSIESSDINHLIALFISKELDEKKHELSDKINRTIGNFKNSYIKIVKDNNPDYIGLVMGTFTTDVFSITILRTKRNKIANILFYQLLTDIMNYASENGLTKIIIDDKYLTDSQIEIIESFEFEKTEERFNKILINGIIETSQLITHNIIISNDIDISSITEKIDSLEEEEDKKLLKFRLERKLWPLKLKDLDIPTYIIPIKSYWASQLFDFYQADQSLFGAKAELVWHRENIYYRNVMPVSEKHPARILWYVSSEKKVTTGRDKGIVACSYLDEVTIASARSLFHRFKNFGIYEWKDVYELAEQNSDKVIKAIKFSDTEVFKNKIDLNKITQILNENGRKKNTFTSPLEVSKEIFNKIYEIGKEL
ncbi:GNAT family N-acetyltransferase [Flavobacterium plurextorum]|mgnify:CR=1 FL=1|uniref:GNAT family N-acetyltransferase n=1 Tax=Flavobacterium plurextorum TaxID=1114867 RepID=UPI00375751DB